MKNKAPITIMLAEDDRYDRDLFEKALKEIPIATQLQTVNNGAELMDYLHENATNLPDVLFLDLSMPRKTGYECLIEIKEDAKLQALHVAIFTTSFTQRIDVEQNLIKTLSNMGSQNYIRKPAGFKELTQVIHQALIRVIEKVA
jgi:CheY-like chemotaxis protein